MRVLARIGFTFGVLVLAAPATAQAQSQPALSKPWNHGMARSSKKITKIDTSHLCNSCQRMVMKMRDGIDAPPAPPMPNGLMVNTGPCSACKKPVMVVREEVRPSMPMLSGAGRIRKSEPAGMAVASDEPMLPSDGMMMVGSEPAPIGVYQQKMASSIPMPSRPGSSVDPSVMTTSAVGPASTPVAPHRSGRPHVLSHLLGFSEIGRDWSEDRERRSRESHARIEYGDRMAPAVNELPAKAVYGR